MDGPNRSTEQRLDVLSVARIDRPRHAGLARRIIAQAAWLPSIAVDALENLGLTLQKIANTMRFEKFWAEKVAADDRVKFVPTFNKSVGKKPIWNAALNWISANTSGGTILEFGTNNGGSLKYFVDHLPRSYYLVGFDSFEGLPEAWDGLPAGSIKGFGAPGELWGDDPQARAKVITDAAAGIPFPAPPQPNVSIQSGLFAESLTRYLSGGWPQDVRMIHFDADLYISTRPVLDTLCGQLKHRYLILFDEFYSVNHEFRAWNEFLALYKLVDWRVVATSEDGSQVLIEVNTRAPLDLPAAT
ncbi:hypothetical protein CCR97_02925 [Rhodoplanes elegans]|uniref:Methyltransferase n=1 Tax=Rhodoplanes elegans TaxID=29408 RepID=A0A327K3F0_9BRAD|nr:hypothetical protein [Rhodoplanes elegans]MBK5957163.1 hypothetical protein [Rhodoplanes elegans]RAI32333.1 hypothetical protein CH338_24345 [Rhodoplanes elegans]